MGIPGSTSKEKMIDFFLPMIIVNRGSIPKEMFASRRVLKKSD
jgi:hypothetical protein